MAARFSKEINISNRKAFYEYETLDKYIAGMALQGTEIKSIREGKVNLQDGYCYFKDEEIFVRGVNIAPYAQGTHYNHEAMRDRKLLLKRQEIRKLSAKAAEKGLSVIPLRLFINARGYAKLELALARGKRHHDKRERIKDRDLKRELGRIRF